MTAAQQGHHAALLQRYLDRGAHRGAVAHMRAALQKQGLLPASAVAAAAAAAAASGTGGAAEAWGEGSGM
jgi:hypothetical protein